MPRVQLIRGLARTIEKADLSADDRQTMPQVSSTVGRHSGVELIPILMWLHVPVLTAVGLSQAIQLPIAILATIGNVIYGTPDYVLGGLLALGLIVGSWLGAKLAHHLPMATLKRSIALVLVAVGAMIIVKISQTLAL